MVLRYIPSSINHNDAFLNKQAQVYNDRWYGIYKMTVGTSYTHFGGIIPFLTWASSQTSTSLMVFETYHHILCKIMVSK